MERETEGGREDILTEQGRMKKKKELNGGMSGGRAGETPLQPPLSAAGSPSLSSWRERNAIIREVFGHFSQKSNSSHGCRGGGHMGEASEDRGGERKR